MEPINPSTKTGAFLKLFLHKTRCNATKCLSFIIIIKQFRTPEKQLKTSDSQLIVQTRLKKNFRGINVHGRSKRSKLALNSRVSYSRLH